MLHTFKALDRYIAMDADSGAVHLLDEMAFDALNAIQAGDVAPLYQKYDEADVRELLGEIEELKAQGALFAEHDYSHLEIEKSGIVKAMCLHAAHDCNLRCKYCFASTGDFHGPRGLLPVETGKRALDWLVAHSGNRKNLEVDFFGGEPLMNFGALKEIVAYGREIEKRTGKVFWFTTTTNCIGLTDEVADYLNEEMHNVVLSIDGRREVHDFMRPTINGKGSYDLVLKNALAFAKKRGDKSYYVRGTFTARNLDFANDVFALADAGFEQISIEPVVLPSDSPYALTEDMLPTIFAEYDRLAAEYVKRRRDGRWFNFFHFMIDLSGGPCVAKRLSGCGSGTEYLAVTPWGDFYPCHQFVGNEKFLMGNVDEGIVRPDIVDEFKCCNVYAKEKCRSCFAKFYCSGGCAANSYNCHGKIDDVYELGCELQKKRVECAIMIKAALADEEE